MLIIVTFEKWRQRDEKFKHTWENKTNKQKPRCTYFGWLITQHTTVTSGRRGPYGQVQGWKKDF